MAELLNLNDNCITLEGLFDKVKQAFVNDAVATVTIRDGDSILVDAQAMPYVANSDGDYRAIILNTVVFPDSFVSVEINAVAGDGTVYEKTDDQVFIPNALPGDPDVSIFFASSEIHNSLVLKAREPEFLFIYYAKFNLTNNTELALKLTDPNGSELLVDALRLSAPLVDINTGDPATQTLSGGTYIQFTTNKTDFLLAGVWRVKGLYIEGDIERPGDSVYFVVGDSFYG